MKKVVLLASAVLAMTFTGCKEQMEEVNPSSLSAESSNNIEYNVGTRPKVTVKGDITANRAFTKGNVYILDGIVKVKAGVTLTIEAGTIIVGKAVTTTTGKPGTLVVTRGGKINAVGTTSAPIIFTSHKLIDGNTATVGAPGDFGGVIILGNAPTNANGSKIEGLEDETFGGSVPSENSGRFQYVRIEYPGHIIGEANEINGLTLGGVGSGTTISHVQVSYSKDDSFEFFGGTVNAKYLVSLAADDDNFDFDNGYVGKIQFALSVADRNSTHSTSGGNPDSNGIESDNNSTGSTTSPITKPVISNLTIVGTSSKNAAYKFGTRWRRNTSLVLANSIVMGYPTGVSFDDALVQNKVKSGASKFMNNLVHGFDAAANVQLGTGNSYYKHTNANYNIKLTQPFYNSTTAMNFVPSSTSPARTGANFSASELSGLTKVTYRGAFGTTNWLAGWASLKK